MRAWNKITGIIWAVLALASLGACSGFSLSRTVYGIGEHYRLESCRHHPETEDCHPEAYVDYDDYRQRRKEAAAVLPQP
jgi:hypothetical protein